VIHPDIKVRQRPPRCRAALAEAVALGDALPHLDVEGANYRAPTHRERGHAVGSGKIEELKNIFEEAEVDLVLVDGPVTPVQQRNLEKAWNVKLLDRTGLILEIFSDRAATREGVLAGRDGSIELSAYAFGPRLDPP